MKHIIDLKNVSFRYDTTVDEYQIDSVSFHVKQGEWLSIVGHNGSGKSTIVRLIDGLLEAESGEIVIDGIPLTRETVWENRSKIGIVFQNPDNQFVGATVEDDVKLACRYLKIENLHVYRVAKNSELQSRGSLP